MTKKAGTSRSDGGDAGNRHVLAEVIEHLSQALSYFDRDLKLVVCNRRYLDLLAFPEWMGVPGTPLETFLRYNAERGEYGPGDPEELVAERIALARRFEPHVFERERPDGVILRVQGTPVEGGGFVTTYTDVTELRRSQEALQRANERLDERVRERTAELAWREAELSQKTNALETILESVPSGITLFDRDLRLVASNRRFFELLDIPETLSEPGTSFEAFMRYNAERGEYGPGDPAALARERVEAASKFQPHRFVRERLDGSMIEVIGRPVADGFVTTYTDVTERVRAEAFLRESNAELEKRVAQRTAELNRQLEETERAEAEMRVAKERAEQANRAKSEFLAQMSHELRTPLNSIIGFSDLCRQEMFGPLGHERYREYLENVHNSGTHLLALINDLLEMARIEAGKIELELADVAVADVVDEAVRLMQERAQAEDISIVVSLPDTSPAIRADRLRVRQMLLNLLSNALKFTAAEGRIDVFARSRADGGLEIGVRDDGPGMDPAEVARALEPFSQVGGKSDRKMGTGLGLSIVVKLIQEHDGELEIDTARGQGVTARLVFPAACVL